MHPPRFFKDIMRFNHRSLWWLLPVLAFLCVGWADSWEAIRATAGTITSVQADFIQEKHLPILTKPLVSEGEFYYQTPRSLRWEYKRPVRSVLLMHDGRVKRYVAGTSGFTEEGGPGLDAMQVVLEEITQWFKGRFDQNPMFTARLEPQGRIILTPKEASFSAVIQRIVINLSAQPGVIQSVIIYESKDAYTRMTFNHTVLNRKIEDEVFSKTP